MKNLLYYSLIIFLTTIMIFGGLTFPQKAKAVLGIGDVVFDPTLFGEFVLDHAEKLAEWGATIAKWVKDDLMKALRDVVAKKIMDYIVNETVRWIQGGGTPKFVSSWSGLAKDAGNIAFDTVINQVGLARLCSPFSLQVKLSLLPVQSFPTQISCTLDQVVSNIKNFYVDFNQGGWPAYASMWNPENNYYGQMLMIQDNLQLESMKKLTAATNEAISGSGFLSVKKCVEWDAEVLQACVDIPGNSFEDCKKSSCIKEQIQTPGAAVGEAVKNSIASDSNWGANIQSWISALVNALINRVMMEGFSAMKNAATGESSNGSPTNSYQNLINSELASQKAQLSSSLSSFLKEEQYLLNAKNKTLSAYQMQQVYLLRMSTTTGCSVSRDDIDNAAHNVVDLNGQTATLQTNINELTSTINAINRAASTIDLAQGTYTTSVVFDKYNTAEFQQQIATGSARTAADQETVVAQTARDSAYNNLVSCTNPSTSNGGDTGR